MQYDYINQIFPPSPLSIYSAIGIHIATGVLLFIAYSVGSSVTRQGHYAKSRV